MPKRVLNPKRGGESASRKCPICHSIKIWKDGIRRINSGSVQRYICRDCGYRYCESTALSTNLNNSGNRQVCAFETKDAKNLAGVEPRKSGLAGATLTDSNVHGELVNFSWWMKKQGYKETTIESYRYALKYLIQLNADLRDPESVKEVLAKTEVSNARKKVVIYAYTLYLKTQGGTWNPPIYKVTHKLPFIPTEQELDALIAGCGKKTSIFLQLLKETAMRFTEACNRQWQDLDLQRRLLTLNNPSKHGNPRIFNISTKLANMLTSLPQRNDYVFGTNNRRTRQSVYYVQRRKLAHRLSNPRLRRIGFHTFRHWKATMLYHETKDILLVNEFLGHKHLDTTMIYIQLQKALFRRDSDDFTVKATRDPEEIQGLLEVGFEYVCRKDDLMFFRKRR